MKNHSDKPWWLYDADSGAYTDSGLPARGEKGEPGEKGDPGEQGVPGEKKNSFAIPLQPVLPMILNRQHNLPELW